MFKVGNRVFHKDTKEYGIIISYTDLGCSRQIIKVMLDSGVLLEVSNLSKFIKVFTYPTK